MHLFNLYVDWAYVLVLCMSYDQFLIRGSVQNRYGHSLHQIYSLLVMFHQVYDLHCLRQTEIAGWNWSFLREGYL